MLRLSCSHNQIHKMITVYLKHTNGKMRQQNTEREGHMKRERETEK